MAKNIVLELRGWQLAGQVEKSSWSCEIPFMEPSSHRILILLPDP